MLLGRILVIFLWLHLVNPQIQINLHLTDWINENNDIQHDCLNVAAHTETESDPRQIISYCMGEWPSKFNITKNYFDQNFTFSQLSKQHVTSEQLYLWSAPIDLIEEYQFYLNQLPHSDNTSSATEIFYNCTLPYFGSKCQYILNNYNATYSSLNEMIYNYHHYNTYEPTLFTCYSHLECHRGPYPSCLDWTEICDGKVDCLDDGLDEEHCWQLEIHQCNENESPCSYGQCIPKSFFRDDSTTPDCLDQSDKMEYNIFLLNLRSPLLIEEPTFMFEDISCTKTNHMLSNTKYALTSSCVRTREDLLSQAMFSVKPNSITDECWTALKCIIYMPISSKEICSILCDEEICNEIIENTCPNIIDIPAYPLFLGHVYSTYDKSKLKYSSDRPPEPTYVCYNDQLLDVPDDGKKLLLDNNNTCRLYENSKDGEPDTLETKWFHAYANAIQKWLRTSTASINNTSEFCNKSIMYQCMNSSKCISRSRLFDLVADCYYIEDENPFPFNNTDVIEELQKQFRCKTTNQCIPFYQVNDGECSCTMSGDSYCADEESDEFYFKKTISFQTICDGYEQLAPEFMEDKNETDETNCEQWPLIHVYNRCDSFWHFLNGSDEINCQPSLSLLNCSENNHICLSSKTKELMCLPIEKANDGIIDCIGAADEPRLCPRNISGSYPYIFYCENETNKPCIFADQLCDGTIDCSHEEDERVCKRNDRIDSITYKGICTKNYELDGSYVAKILCRLFANSGRRPKIYFTFDQSENSIGQYSTHDGDIHISLDEDPIPKNVKFYQQYCHRGLHLQVWLDKQTNITASVCLCPPSFYGDICQYQNQRVSLTLQFRVSSDSVRTPFVIIVSLIDHSDERIIHSSEQLTYLSIKHCQRKFNSYLLYSTRPKNSMKNYSIHIDIYEKITLNYRGSVVKALNFSFLPVHRLAFQMDIPPIREKIESCLDHRCIHGKCIKYFNDSNNATFCQCDQGWSGPFCTISHTCLCSSQSLCIGKLANNRSLCVCPLNKMGFRCLLDNTVCQNNGHRTCLNGGQCILLDEYEISTKKFTCICLNGFSGDRCETNQTRIMVSVDKNIILPSSILLHFIEIKVNAFPVRTTTYKTIPIITNSIVIHWSVPFHIVFAELSKETYYLIHMQKIHQQSAIIRTTINSSNQCLHVKELFNKTIANSSLLHRIKYYHLPCQTNSSELLCFYDEIQLCLCQKLDQQYVANCFAFDHNLTMFCTGPSDCQHGGRCFQEYTECPRISICECPDCFYGTRCQLSTNSFSLSLDAILGYHIHPNLKILEQPRALLISLILSTILILGGLINGILSLLTFKNPKTRESGCGIYLLCSSIIVLFTMVIFTLKFSILIISHMGLITNQSFLNIQCILIDFLLQICLTMDQWLSAFVSIERAFVILKGLHFNKEKTKFLAKWAIFTLLLIIILTDIPDPMNRSLFEENNDDEKRFWCTVNYSSTIRIINYIINTLHFIIPFIIHLISASIIISIKTRQQIAVQTEPNYRQILNEQIQQHKNLLISPFVLIILVIPRLIITFASGCMKSANDSWLFLFGYFISLIPSTLTFILFVLPSTVYKQEFRKAISQYRKIFKRRL